MTKHTSSPSTTRRALEQFLGDLLNPVQYKDYGPNGLQIEGCERISSVAFAVSATLDSIRQAIEREAQALIVHHGLFWNFHGVRPLVGPFARRVLSLARADINLFAYHLPLDAHPRVGNAACIAEQLGIEQRLPFGMHEGMPTGVMGRLPEKLRATALRERVATLTRHPVLLSSPDESAEVATLGIITGGASGGWADAAREGVDAFLTGEMSEHDWHEAQEAGVHMYAAGHHATEVFGIQRLMREVEQHVGLNCFFIDSPNPA